MIGRWMISKAGGPALFVQEIVSDRVVVCCWMDPMGQHKSGQFALDSLEPLEPLESRPIDQVRMAFASSEQTSSLDALQRLKARLRAVATGAVASR
jgi:uncharacterized protein YodC (DUF2158 family)